MSQPHRIGFKFWLNLDNDHDEQIADTIELLKNERSFTQTIRDGIRLIWDLRQGNVAVLCELFPFVKDKLGTRTDSNIKADIERLER
ncbi:MAG: hypothetical protein AAFQ52_14005, partial [Chloroflexota bacterium]